jgi:hypothetical protein
MPATDELAEHIMRVASDPARLAVEAAKCPPTPFTTALGNCTAIDEKVVLFSRVFDVDALPAFISLHRWDKASVVKAAADLDRNGLHDLAGIVRAEAKTAKLKVSAAISAKRQAQRQSKRAFLRALAAAKAK